MKNEIKKPKIIIYQIVGDEQKIRVRIEDENVWLTQKLIAELYGTTPQNITQHLKSIYTEGEVSQKSTCKDFLQVQQEGKRKIKRITSFYSLEVIIAVGYRVNSERGTQFRKWATERLREFLIKGFTLDDERLKQGGSRARYFQELLQRVRDIRSSERRFYQKITDIYSKCSIDYDPESEITEIFFIGIKIIF